MNDIERRAPVCPVCADALLTRVNERFRFEPNGSIPECLIVEGITGGYYKATPKDVYDFVKMELAPFLCAKCQDGKLLKPGCTCPECLAQNMAVPATIEQKVVLVPVPFKGHRTSAEYITVVTASTKAINEALQGGWAVVDRYSQRGANDDDVVLMVTLQRETRPTAPPSAT